MEHFSTQVESIVKLGFQILEIQIDNTAAAFLSALMLQKQPLLHFGFWNPQSSCKIVTTVYYQHDILRIQLAITFLKAGMKDTTYLKEHICYHMSEKAKPYINFTPT